MSYARTYTIDDSPTGDTVKVAIVDKIDKDLTSAVGFVNTHEALTETHGATGAVVGTTNIQTLTNKTVNGATLSGTITGTNATLTGCTVSGTVTGGTLAGTSLSGVTTCADLRLTNGVFTGTITASAATLVGFGASFDNATFTGTTTIATANIAAGTITATLTAGTLGSTTTTNAGTIQGGTISGATITATTLSSTCTVGGVITGSLSSPTINGTCAGTAFTKDTSATGYAKLGGGLILQWGTTTTIIQAGTAVTFPLTFPNACLNVTVSEKLAGPTIKCITATINNVGQFTAYCQNSDGGYDGPGVIYWQAIGY